MKVYVVTSGEYSDYHIDAVCIDKRIAETIASSLNAVDSYGYDNACVNEYDTDDYSAQKAKSWVTYVQINKKNPIFINPDTTYVCCEKISFNRSKRTTPLGLAVMAHGTDEESISFTVFTAPDDDEDKALKIARDMIAQANYFLSTGFIIGGEM